MNEVLWTGSPDPHCCSSENFTDFPSVKPLSHTCIPYLECSFSINLFHGSYYRPPSLQETTATHFLRKAEAVTRDSLAFFQNFSLSRLGFLRLPSPQEQVWEEGLENGGLAYNWRRRLKRSCDQLLIS